MTKSDYWFKTLSIATISFWLAFFSLVPLGLVLVISFLERNPSTLFVWKFTFNNYLQLLNPEFFRILMHSLFLSAFCTLVCLILAYPAAFFIASASPKYKSFLLLLMVIPFWTSSLIRTYAILILLKSKGIINAGLIALGIIHHPIQILYTNTAVIIGIIYNLLPYMILPLYSNIEKLDPNIFDAARDLGASRLKTLLNITLPLTLPGIVAGTILVFLPSMTLFYIPDILGGAKSILLGNLVENQFLFMNDWPGGSATSIVLSILMLILMIIYRKTRTDNEMQDLL